MKISLTIFQVPATVYVKKTAAGQQAIDISGLEAPAAAAGSGAAGKVRNSSSCDSGQGSSSSCSEASLYDSQNSLNGSQNSLLSCSDASLTDGEKTPSQVEMNGNSTKEQNGNSELKGSCSTSSEKESLLVETAVS